MHQPAAENRALGENHAVQNTNEVLSRSLLYAARNSEAAEIRKLYEAEDDEAAEITKRV